MYLYILKQFENWWCEKEKYDPLDFLSSFFGVILFEMFSSHLHSIHIYEKYINIHKRKSKYKILNFVLFI